MDESGPQTMGDDYQTPTWSPPPDGPSAELRRARSRFTRLRLLYRGKYVWLFLIVLVLAMFGGFIGRQRVELLYRSKGTVRIEPRITRFMYKLEDWDVIPMFEEYVNTQMEYMRSPRTILSAMSNEKWRALGSTADSKKDPYAEFERKLSVGRGDSGSVIHVSYTDPDPTVAQVAVESTIEAYMSIFVERDQAAENRRLKALEGLKTNLQHQINSGNARIGQIAKDYGAKALAETHMHRLRELHKLESKLRAAQTELVARTGKAIDTAKAQAADPPRPLSAEEIAGVHPGMQALFKTKESLTGRLAVMRRQGFLDKHKDVVRMRAALGAVEDDIEHLTLRLNEDRLLAGSDAATSVDPGESIEELKARVSGLQKRYDREKADTLDLGRKVVEIGKLQKEVARNRDRHDATRNRIEQLILERDPDGKVEVLSLGRKPSEPINAGARRRSTVIDAVGGAAVGIGLILIVGLFIVGPTPVTADDDEQRFAAERASDELTDESM